MGYAAKKMPGLNREQIGIAVQDLDLTRFDCWPSLRELSNKTVVDDIEVFPDEILGNEDAFSGALNVFVTLEYEGFTSSDAFPGVFRGHIEKGKPTIDRVTIDTSSFYE